MNFAGINTTASGLENFYRYNGKELQKDLDLNWYDYGARFYDPTIVRTPQQDPHSENYFSISPYSFLANNPILFQDPTGKDILFTIFESDGNGNWKETKATYNQLGKQMQKALYAFASTKIGKSFLGQFAKEGDKIGDITFEKGSLSDKTDLHFREIDAYGSGSSNLGLKGDKAEFTLDIYTGRDERFDSDERYAQDVGHEAFIHIEEELRNVAKAMGLKDINSRNASMNEIVKRFYKTSRDRSGGPDHDKFIQSIKSHNMTKYVGELKTILKNILNPTNIDNEFKKHNETYRKQYKKK